MQLGQGYLKSSFEILHFNLYTSRQGDQGPNGDDSWKLSPLLIIFNLVRQEASVTREMNISLGHFL